MKAKIIQSAKLYLQKEGEKEMRHVTNWPIFLKVCKDLGLSTNWKDRVFLNDKDFPPKGKPITEWPEGEEPPPEQRKMSILWMGDEKWLNDFGGTHIVGFHEPCRPDWYPPHKIKLISFLKRDSSDEGIERRVEAAKNHPNNGGWWTILLHEPDAQRTWPNEYLDDLKRRVEEYQMIRAIDTDPWNHPVVAVFDMTSQFSVHPGWQNAFTGEDHDVFLIDCYAAKGDGSLDVKGMEAGGRLVEIGLSRSKGQFIPCIKACRLEDDKTPNVVGQFEWWDEHFGPLMACAFWSSGIGQAPVIGVYEDEKIAEQVKEVNRMLGLLK